MGTEYAPQVSLGLTFNSVTEQIYLRAYPKPTTPPFTGPIRLSRADALALAQQLNAALHYLGHSWTDLMPAAADLPDPERR